jgi:hypothetical protein
MPALLYLLYHIIRGAVDDSANKLTYETDMLVEANETFLKKDKALVGRSLVQASKNVFVRVMNPSYSFSKCLTSELCLGVKCSWERSSRLIKSVHLVDSQMS